MKKLLLTVLVAAALVSCNEKKNNQVSDQTVQTTEQSAEAAEQQAGDGAESVTAGGVVPGTTQATTDDPAKLAKDLEEAKAKCNYVPTGNIEKDAQDFVDMQLELAAKDIDGKATKAETDRVTAVMYILGEYYTNKGKVDEFKAVLGKKMAEGVKKLQMEKIGS